MRVAHLNLGRASAFIVLTLCLSACGKVYGISVPSNSNTSSSNPTASNPIFTPTPVPLNSGLVSTFIGAYPGADGTGTAARFGRPSGIVVDSRNNIFVADQVNSIIRKVTPSGDVTTIAGVNGKTGHLDGPANTAKFTSPSGLAIDSSDNIYVADTSNNVIRKITPNGIVSTYAGVPTVAGSADGSATPGPGVSATFNAPAGVAMDSSTGTLYVADSGNSTIRKITNSGVVSTLAGMANTPGSSDGLGNIARFHFPAGIAFTGASLLVADTFNHTIRKVSLVGNTTTLAGQAGTSGTADGPGVNARFDRPFGIIQIATGFLITDLNNKTIRHMDGATNDIHTVAGSPLTSGISDGPGTTANFSGPYGMAMDSNQDIYITDFYNNTLRKMDINFNVVTIAGTYVGKDANGVHYEFQNPAGMTMDSHGNLFVADQDFSSIKKVTPGGEVTNFAGSNFEQGLVDATGDAARFYGPTDLTIDANDNLYVADRANHVIRKITPNAVVTTLAGNPSGPGSSDGTGSAARFNEPSGITMGADGNLYVSDTLNGAIRKVTLSGVVTTYAGQKGNPGTADGIAGVGQLGTPYGLVFDSSGTLFVMETMNSTLRKVSPDGSIQTFTSNGSTPTFLGAFTISSDAYDNLYIAEMDNGSITKIDSNGDVTPFLGTPATSGYEDGHGTAARFAYPTEIYSAPDGTLYVGDPGNRNIRKSQ